jgi:hypothetical protein
MGNDSERGNEADSYSANRLIGNRPHPLESEHVCEALAHPRRRYLCCALLDDATRTLPDLATEIAAWEDGVPEHAVTEARRQRVYVSLYHVHVPKLADEAVVAFDDVAETVTLTENADRVLTALEGIEASLDKL